MEKRDREKRKRKKSARENQIERWKKRNREWKIVSKILNFFPLMCFIQTDKLLSRIVEMKQNAAINEHISIVIMKKTGKSMSFE